MVELLQEKGLMLKKGTIVDSTIIKAPLSTRNWDSKRDPDAHSTRKGNTGYFGYKVHIGVDKDSGLVHSVKVTAANVQDVTVAPESLKGKGKTAYGDSGYLGAEKRDEAVTHNRNGKKIQYKINCRPSQPKNVSARFRGQIRRREHEKSSVYVKIEHIFGIVKGQLQC